MVSTFVHIGPPRTGTTWLYYALVNHVGLPAPPLKETRFFDTNFSKGPEWYRARFKLVEGQPWGEICPTYFISPEAPERIAQLMPAVRIVCTLRDPVPRLYSLYRILNNTGAVRVGFEEAIVSYDELVETARYTFHVQRWLDVFGADRVLVMLYDDLLTDPYRYIKRFCEFIGASPPTQSAIPKGRIEAAERFKMPRFPQLSRLTARTSNWLVEHQLHSVVSFGKRLGLRSLAESRQELPVLSPVAEVKLRARFQPEIEELERLLGVDLSQWKDCASVAAG
jgi:hypothetical protein